MAIFLIVISAESLDLGGIRMIEIILVILMALIIGIFVGWKLKPNKQVDTDACISTLKEKGYWVNLNAGPRKEL